MEVFYHFSHFLEILTGIYFGGFALLGFIQRGASENIYRKLKYRKNQANQAKVIINEYFEIRTKSFGKAPFKNLLISLLGFLFWAFGCGSRFISFIVNNQIEKIGDSEKEVVLKKYFPSFFFSGCFCLTLILLSAFQNNNVNVNCHKAVDFFLIYYLISSIIFQIWALFIFPHIVNRIDYLHLILLNLLIIGILIYFSISFSRLPYLKSNLAWFLIEANKGYLILFVILVTLIPLFYIIFRSVFMLVAWEVPIFFNKVIFNVFKNSKQEAEEFINKLTDNE